MSLIDALLLESWRDPREVWIALRSDGLKGSGTLDDPYDGSTRNYSNVAIASLSAAGSLAAASTGAVPHGFSPGEWVTISGVSTAQGGDIYYTGTFAITVTSPTSFTYSMLGESASSTASGTITGVREREQFDQVMRGLPANCCVHLGPGVFESKGATGGINGWDPKSGQRIVGSGVGVTVLKLVGASWPEKLYGLVFSNNYAAFLEDFEVSDLTFDCNAAGQPNQSAACTAISIAGKHVRFRRLRAVNFASQTRGYVENFIFYLSSPHPDAGADKEGVNCVMEDCIAEQPGLNPSLSNNTVFMLASGERPGDGIMSYHRAFGIRHCYFDGAFTDRPASIASITISGGVATVTTRTPHLRNNNDWVNISGALENGSEQSAYNGSYQVSNVSTYQFTYTPVAYGGLPVPTTNPTGEMWVGRVTRNYIAGTSLTYAQVGTDYIATLTTLTPHFRLPGNIVAVNTNGTVPDGAKPYYGPFTVLEVVSPVVLKYKLASQPSAAAVPDIVIGAGHQGLSGDGGAAAVVEGNHIFNTPVGGPYHDTWATKDILARNNYYYNINTGIFQNLGGVSATNDSIALVSLTNSGTTAIATTLKPHGLIANDIDNPVRISGVLGTDGDIYNGVFTITSIPNSREFRYSMSNTPTGPGSNASFTTADFQRPLVSLIYSGSVPPHTVTAQVSYAKHSFQVGDVVKITKASQSGFPNASFYNGFVRITAVPSVNTFQYQINGTPGVDSSSSDFCPGYYGLAWRAKGIVFEDNVLSLGYHRMHTSTDYFRPIGAFLYNAGLINPQFRFHHALLRGNIIGHVAETPDTTGYPVGIEVYSVGNGLVERNVVNVARPILHYQGGSQRFMQNQSPAGKLVNAVNGDTFQKADDIETFIEDSMSMAIL